MPHEQKPDPWREMESDVDGAANTLCSAYERLIEAKSQRLAVKPPPGVTMDGAPPLALPTAQEDAIFKEVCSSLQQVMFDLTEMAEALQNAVEHPDKYSLSSTEIQRRQEFIRSVERRIERVKSEVAKGESERRRLAALKSASGGEAATASSNGANNEFIRGEMDQQLAIREEHDQALDRLHVGMTTLKVKANQISDVMDEHNKSLDQISVNMSALQVKMEGALKRVGKLLDESSDRNKIICIVVLFLILIGLFALMITDANAT